MEYNPGANEFVPRGNWYWLTENEHRPAIIFGTSSDRIGTPEHKQAYFVTFAKRLEGLHVAPYFTVNYSEFDKGLNFPFGASVNLHPNWSVLGMNDGRKTHLMLNYRQKEYGVSLMWVWMRKVGISVTTGF